MSSNRIGKSYDYRAICDVCGFKKWNYELRKRWDGLMCCKEDWEPRNFLDFYRTRNDAHRLPFTRPDSQEVSTEVSFPGNALALQFGQSAQTPNIPYLVTAYPVTVEAMVLFNTPQVSGQLANIMRYSSGHLIFRFEVAQELTLYFQNPISNRFVFISAPPILSSGLPLNTWGRLSAVMTSDSTGSFYVSYAINGVVSRVVDTAPTFGVIGAYTAGPSPFVVGSVLEGSVPYVDDVRIFNVARTQTQIQTYWNSVIPTTTSGLVSNYRFDEGIIRGIPSPITVDSVSPGTRDLTLQGASYFPHMMSYSNSGV